MSPAATDHLSAAFAALADPTRRAILARLALGDTSVGELVQPFPISGPAISRHLRVLEDAGLIERQVDAQWRICKLRPPGLQVASDWLDQYREFWEGSLDRLVEVLEQGSQPDAVAPGSGTSAESAPATRRSPRFPLTRPLRRRSGTPPPRRKSP